MKRIMILGDSWGRGEWAPGKTREPILHGGTAQYLREAGHQVSNNSMGSSTNQTQLDRLGPEHPNRHRSLLEAEVILWFFTDPLRDLVNSSNLGVDLDGFDLVGYQHQPRTMDTYRRINDHLCRHTLAHMARLSQGRTVLMVGGVSPVPAWTTEVYPEWRVVTRDWVRWLVPHTKVSMAHSNRTYNYPDCDEELLEFHEQNEEKSAGFRWRAEHRPASDEHKWFWPDGAHPNREAHQKLTQELILPLL
jgi:hypothetical protein